MKKILEDVKRKLPHSKVVAIQEVKIAADHLLSRLSNAQKSTDDLIAAFSNPANPLTDIELAVLKVNAEQAEKDGNKELASLFNFLVNLVETKERQARQEHLKTIAPKVDDRPLDQKLADYAPDFLIISPTKTGTNWLFRNIDNHPQAFMPSVKEVEYFSLAQKWFDLDWYLNFFKPGLGKIKGESSPLYAILPLHAIQSLHAMLPNLKLIFLMRDPINRAWSNAKHDYKFRCLNFCTFKGDIKQVTYDQWVETFTQTTHLVQGDYLGCLQRWLSVFPANQIYLEFFETIIYEPDRLMREIYQFLGLDLQAGLDKNLLKEKIFAGLEEDLPDDLSAFLRTQFRARTRELVFYLKKRFNLTYPNEWKNTLMKDSSPDAAPWWKSIDDDRLDAALAQVGHDAIFPADVSDPQYGIYLFRSKYYAVSEQLGWVNFRLLDDTTLQEYIQSGLCFIGDSLKEVRSRIYQGA